MSSAGKFKIDVWRGGYPVWCDLTLDGRWVGKVSHSELRDLAHAVEQAMREARQELRRMGVTEDEV
jgi:hypothetical protein